MWKGSNCEKRSIHVSVTRESYSADYRTPISQTKVLLLGLLIMS